MISVQGYREDKVEIKIHKNQLLKILEESTEIEFNDILEILILKFIKSCEPKAEFVDEGKHLAYWEEYYHGSPSLKRIRELTEEELEIYAAINKIIVCSLITEKEKV